MAATDLTTVGAVQSFLGLDPTIGAPLFQRLVTAASNMALTRMSRNILSQTYTGDRYNGTGTNRLMLAQWPITAVALVQVYASQVNPLPIPPAPNSQSYGYMIDRGLEMLDFIGGRWAPGQQNIAITYTAGYADGVVTSENVNVSAVAPYSGALVQGDNLRALTSLVYAVGGAALTQVASNPAAGQYTLSPVGALGFAAADAGAALLANYTTNGTPADLNLAIVEWVAWTYQKRQRLDRRGETLAQQTISYDMGAMPAQTSMVISDYTRPFAV